MGKTRGARGWKDRGAMISLTRVAVLAATQRKQFGRSVNDKPAIAIPSSPILSLSVLLLYSCEHTLEGQPLRAPSRVAGGFIRDTREIRKRSAVTLARGSSLAAPRRIDASSDRPTTLGRTSPRVLDTIFWHARNNRTPLTR